MIISTFLYIVYYFLYGVISVLPNGGVFPPEFLSSLNTIWNAMSLFSLVVPVSTLLSVLGLAMVWHLFVWVWNTMHWIISIVRGVNVLR